MYEKPFFLALKYMSGTIMNKTIAVIFDDNKKRKKVIMNILFAKFKMLLFKIV